VNYIKSNWNSIKNHIQNIEPSFYKEVNKLSPCDKFPIYIFNYSYGDFIGDEKGVFIPNENSSIRIGEKGTPKEIIDDLGYGAKTCPLGMTFNKQFEWFNTRNLFPVHIDKPGTLFGLGHTSNFLHPNEVYLPNGKLAMIAGARSTFLLPKISNQDKHKNLQERFNFNSPSPLIYNAHFNTFLNIYKGKKLIDEEWSAQIIYFSKSWIESINNDYEWRSVSRYISNLSEYRSRYHRENFLHSDTYRYLNDLNSYTQNNYIAETVRYLIEVMIGQNLAYAPAQDESAVPLRLIQEAYLEDYRLDCSPQIMIPSYYKVMSSKPVYYSLNYPSIQLSATKMINYKSIMKILGNLKNVIEDTYLPNLSSPIQDVKGTCLETCAKQVRFKFIHSNSNSNSNSKSNSKFMSPDLLPQIDNRFENIKLSSKSPFFQGCIAIA